ncbi:hypothetical protein Aab01nite_65470 [Paractinoplanes abujensis]|uniref:SUKH superfamily protein n=1 Tax=Paractinoplanes abujensis TaxID=882441 RepID=A0A7W7G1V9_9ACTN|nr:hypothetical protein [Actinoplanes abujensis]MBB4692545.1 hypothetical protein [Actinoplanes abujensis]GID22957.1 hypothetical protein Aab01nite_65470 [Actinoplanes abujensis]
MDSDYKAFINTYGAGMVDDHISVCAPGAAEDWAELIRHNTYAHECVRLDFAGPEGYVGDWQLGDASRWAPGREDVPAWFEPGDDLISWGHTGNGDFLFWHVQPGAAPEVWPVVFKERGPFWERYRTGFCTAMAGLLTGEIQSEYLSDPLGGPHSYNS